MKNKLQSFFFLTLCLVAIIGGTVTSVTAQISGADKILSAGKTPLKQSEVSKLIEFYEWAFQVEFTEEERARYQAFIVQGFREDAMTARNNTDSLIQSLGKLLALDADRQAKARARFNEGFVKDLRAADDEGSRLLLGIYNRSKNYSAANEDDSTTGKKSRSQPNPTRGGTNASELVGTWLLSTGVGGLQAGGKMLANSGTKTSFEFAADGTVNVSIESKTLSVMQCRIIETTKISGRYAVNGSELTMNLSGGTASGTNSCDRSENFNKKLSASTLRKTFIVKEMKSQFRPDRPLILCLDGAADEKCFQRDPTK